MGSARIMIVEDNAMVARDLSDCLEEQGYQVVATVSSGEESIDRAGAEHPDAVIMDIQLRDRMDGIEAAEQIHTRFGIPVVFLSAYSDQKLLERAKRVGSFGYLVKPFEEHEVCATLEMALFKARTDAALLEMARLEATSTLAGGIAHDCNNLMCSALGYTELLQNELGQGHRSAWMLKEIETAARRTSDLAQRLLHFARSGALKLEPVELNQVVRESLRTQVLALPYRIQFTSALEDGLGRIRADRAHLEVILKSLISNAVEAIAGEGQIHVATGNREGPANRADRRGDPHAGSSVMLSVSDTGCGMSAEVQARAFTPFYSTKFTGRGLGLASVYGIVKSHAGEIELKSLPNEGTTVTILFPALEPEAGPPTEPVRDAAPRTGTILVVDDEILVRRPVSLLLERCGHQVLVAEDGLAAVRLARGHAGPIDVALLDLCMSRMDGPAAFPLLREARPEMKILLFSGYAQDAAADALLAAGAVGYLKKPVSSDELAEAIRNALAS